VIVAGIVMFNILKLTMKIVPNYPTHLGGCSQRQQRSRRGTCLP
jgi:hypothetical protein